MFENVSKPEQQKKAYRYFWDDDGQDDDDADDVRGRPNGVLRLRRARLNFGGSKLLRSLYHLIILVMMPLCCISTQAQSSHEDPLRWEVGGHYTLLNIESNRVGCGECRVNNSGLGLNLGFNFRRWIGFDSEMNFFPDPGVGATNQEGGRVTQGLFGLKAGITREKWGLFAKVRPGFVSNGSAIIAVSPTPPPFSFTFGRLTHFATDIGGIFEYHVTRRISFRTDLGDTIVRHGTQTSPSIIGQTLTTPTYYRDSLQWSTGIIFRF